MPVPPSAPVDPKILQAVDFAADKHRDQRRKGESAEPYINHPLEVTRLLAEATGGRDPLLLMGGILHDTVEDTDTTLEEIERTFGRQVRELVAEVTDDTSLPSDERKRRQIAELPRRSERARMIRMADKISNMRSILDAPPKGWDRDRKLRYFTFTRAVAEKCRGVNEDLDRRFAETYQRAMTALGADDGPEAPTPRRAAGPAAL